MTKVAPRPSRQQPYDVALVGAGFANAMIAAAVLHHHPTARIAVVERKPPIVRNQTWCFHHGDMPSADVWTWLKPFVAYRWDGYDVAFPAFRRGFDSGYLGISGAQFETTLATLFGRPEVDVYEHQTALDVQPGQVTLADGTPIFAQLVLDGRGISARTNGAGFQKFVGWEVEVSIAPNGAKPMPARPLLMDATVEQVDGYRFVYVLPLSQRRMLVEDTYFSSDSELASSAIEPRLEQYFHQQGWKIDELLRVEQGVLPMPWLREAHETPFAIAGVFQVGYRGGWYHPATGYSAPVAIRVAAAIAGVGRLEPGAVRSALEPLWAEHEQRASFYRLLNRLAFRGVKDADRLAVFQRFYRLPEPLVSRFYASQSTWWDRARILGGKPPVPFSRFQMARLMEEVS